MSRAGKQHGALMKNTNATAPEARIGQLLGPAKRGSHHSVTGEGGALDRHDREDFRILANCLNETPQPLPELANALLELLAAKGNIECGLHADKGLVPLLHLGLCAVIDIGQGRRRVTVTPAGRERWAQIKAAASEVKVTTPMPADRLQRLRESLAARMAARRSAKAAETSDRSDVAHGRTSRHGHVARLGKKRS